MTYSKIKNSNKLLQNSQNALHQLNLFKIEIFYLKIHKLVSYMWCV
jgi:hypothetical protein